MKRKINPFSFTEDESIQIGKMYQWAHEQETIETFHLFITTQRDGVARLGIHCMDWFDNKWVPFQSSGLSLSVVINDFLEKRRIKYESLSSK